MIDNEFYKDLGEKWFTSEGDALALLRQENAAKLPWVLSHLGHGPTDVLDVGCGGGFLSLALAAHGHHCTGLDVSESILAPGRKRDTREEIRWVVGRAEKLPFPKSSFSAVCIMDVLEHVADSREVLNECIRVLKPGGLLLIHTFNRTWMAWLFAVRGLDWIIRHGPRHIHDWHLFIKPEELKQILREKGMNVVEIRGIQPRIWSRAFLRLLLTGKVPATFRFEVGGNLRIGYLVAAEAERDNSI